MKLSTSPGDAGQRLDIWLVHNLPEMTRSRLQSLIKEGAILFNGRSAKPNTKIIGGDEIDVSVPEPRCVEVKPQRIALKVVFEDKHIIVINKKPGIVVHPSAGHEDGTLVNALLYHCKDLKGIGGELRPGIVHRLDKDTSGLLVAAKSEQAMNGLVEQFKAGTIYKEYVAVVKGVPFPPAGRIETKIGRSRHDRKKMAAFRDEEEAEGRVAVTNYDIIEGFKIASLMKVVIETGRTHQIRVHMSHIGHPVLGDQQYGRHLADVPVKPARQMLHARKLCFKHPVSGKDLVFETELPADMKKVLKELRSN